jgi:hypothetical protein
VACYTRSHRASADSFAPNAFVRIGAPDDSVTLVMPQVEMGQGTYTSMSMDVAEYRIFNVEKNMRSDFIPTLQAWVKGTFAPATLPAHLVVLSFCRCSRAK